MIDRIDKLLEDRKVTQKALEQQIGLGVGRFSKWKGGQGEPTARQALAIARLLRVPFEWLCDDAAPDEPPAGAPSLAPDERTVLTVYRVLRDGGRIDVEGAVRALYGPPAEYDGEVRETARRRGGSA